MNYFCQIIEDLNRERDKKTSILAIEMIKADPTLFPQIYSQIISQLSLSECKQECLYAAKIRMPLSDYPELLEEAISEMGPWGGFGFCYDFVKHQKVDTCTLEELIAMCHGVSMEKLALYTEALYKVGSAQEKMHKDWLEKAWEIFLQGEFVLGKYDPDNDSGLAFHFPAEGVNNMIRYRMNITRALGILFAFKPDEMGEIFARIIKKTARHKKYFDSVREWAIQPLFVINPKWILLHLQEWSHQPWWPKKLDDDLFAVINRIPSAELAIKALSAFVWDGEKVRLVLDRVHESSEMRKCFEVLTSMIALGEYDIQRDKLNNQTQVVDFVNICVKYAPVADIDPFDLLFAKLKRSFSVREKIMQCAGLFQKIGQSANR